MQVLSGDPALAPAGAENVVLLFDVSPAGFNAILKALPDGRGARLAYDGDVLEIMSPSAKHEGDASVLDAFFRAISTERRIEIESLGSLTLRRGAAGAEPDSCFYIGDHARMVRGKRKIKLSHDPPPDIVVEVDISRARIDKRLLYAHLGVPEFWRYDGLALTAYALSTSNYLETANSMALPWLRIADVERFLKLREDLGQTQTIAAWQAWLRESVAADH